MLSLALFALLLLASPSLSLSPRSYQANRSNKAARFPSGKYRPINARFVRRSPMPAGAAGPGKGQELAGAPVTNITVTPTNIVQCGTATIAWTGAAEPVDISIGQGGFYVGITPITTLSSLSGGSTSWVVNQASGESLIFELKDANGAVGYIQNVPVGASGDASCLDGATASSSVWVAPSATDSNTPAAAATSSDDGGDGGDDDGNAGTISATPVATTSATGMVTTSLPKTTSTSTAPKSTTPSASPSPSPSPTASGDLGNAALAGALSASASATAKSGSAAVVSVSFLAVVGGMMAVISFISV